MDNKTTEIKAAPVRPLVNSIPDFDMNDYLVNPNPEQGENARPFLPAYPRVLWFRMKNPNGKIVLFPYSITDKVAIMECRIYENKEDAADNFLANGFAQCFFSTENEFQRNYIATAATAAIGKALALAGYGIEASCMDFPEPIIGMDMTPIPKTAEKKLDLSSMVPAESKMKAKSPRSNPMKKAMSEPDSAAATAPETPATAETPDSDEQLELVGKTMPASEEAAAEGRRDASGTLIPTTLEEAKALVITYSVRANNKMESLLGPKQGLILPWFTTNRNAGEHEAESVAAQLIMNAAAEASADGAAAI